MEERKLGRLVDLGLKLIPACPSWKEEESFLTDALHVSSLPYFLIRPGHVTFARV